MIRAQSVRRRGRQLIRAAVPRSIRNWLRSPTRSAQWVRGEIQYAFGLTQTIEMRPGWLVTCHPIAYEFAYHPLRSDPEQVAEFDAFISSARPGMLLFDIG